MAADTKRYWWLAAMLFCAMALQTANQYWAGDFWEHAAVVRELARHPWAPHHPLFLLNAPHPHFTPYALVAGLTARVSRLHPITVLALFGLGNLVAFLVSLRLFVSTLLQRGAAFFSLVFTLLLWGMSPWRYSGFLHLYALGFVLPYPSIFAFWLMLAALYALLRFKQCGEWPWAAGVAISSAIVLLTHPITSIMLATGLVAFSLDAVARRPKQIVALTIAVLAACAVSAWSWPYFPWFRLMASGSDTYAIPNLAMYEGVLQRTWPALIGVPFVIRRLIADRLDGLALFVVGLSIVYGLGAIITNGPLGRVLPGLVFGLHLALADGVAGLESRLRQGSPAGIRRFYLALSAVIALGLLNVSPALLRVLPRALLTRAWLADPRLEREIDVYGPLTGHIGEDDVVMADLNISRHVPAFGGKVVAFIDPEAFVPDYDLRRQAMSTFLGTASTDERRAIAATYTVRFVAIDLRNGIAAPTERSLEELGPIVFDNGRLRLFQLSGH